MKTKCKSVAKGSGKSGFIAAIAVLAIAFVVLASVTVVTQSGDVQAESATAFPSATSDVITLTSDVEITLEGDQTVKAKTIDLAGYDLTVKGKGVLTLEAMDLHAAFLKNTSTTKQSVVTVTGDGAELKITNEALGKDETTGNSLIFTNATGQKGISFVATDKANLSVSSKDSSVSTIQTGSGNTFVTLSSGAKLNYDGGSVQGLGLVMKSSTATIKNMDGTTFAAYWSLDASTVTAGSICVYSADLKNKSSITASGDVAFYSNSAGANAFTAVDGLKDLKLSTATVDKDSTFSAKTFYSAFNWISSSGTRQQITFSGEGTVTGNLEFVYKNYTNTLGYAFSGVLFTGKASYTGANEVMSSVEFNGIRAGTDGKALKVVAGSIEIAGAVVSGNSIIVSGEGKVTGNTEIPNGMTLIVQPGATLNVEDGVKLTIESGATLKVAGELTTGTGSSVANEGSLVLVNGGDASTAAITGDGKVSEVTEDTDMENISIEGIIKGKDNKYDASQIVTIAGNTTMSEDSKLQINGRLVVPAGVTLTLEPGAELVLANNAVLDLEGSIVVKEAYDTQVPKVTVESGRVNVYGSLVLGAELDVQKGTFVVKQDGELIIESTGSFTAGTNATVEVEASGTVNANGSVEDMTIKNNGTINFDSQVASGDVTVVMGDGAVLDLMAITLKDNGVLTVQDVDKNNAVQNTIVVSANTTTDDPAKPGYVGAVIKGLKISETITSETSGNRTYYDYAMYLSGDASVSATYVTAGSENEPEMKATAKIGTDGWDGNDRGIVVAEALTIGENIVLENKGGLVVTALLDGTKGGIGMSKAITHIGGYIYPEDSGLIVLKDRIDGETAGYSVQATRYSTGTGSDARVNYVTLDAAMAAASEGISKEFTAIAYNELTKSATLPGGVKLDLKDAKLEILSKDEDENDITLTIAKGASVKNAPSEIWNYGTIYAEDKANVDSAVRDKFYDGSNVYSEQLDDKGRAMRNGWAKWTNVASALAEAEEGSVVKITNHYLPIRSNLTIPEGVTLDSNNQMIAVSNNVTLTVNGTLFINQGAGTETLVLNKGTSPDKDAAVVLNGQIMSDKEIKVLYYGGSEVVIAGAYYAMTSGGSTMYYATTVDKAAPMLSSAVSQTIALKGDKLTVGDVTFMGKSATEMGTVEVKLTESLTASSITLGNATLKFTAVTSGLKFNGTVKDAAGSIVLNGTVGLDGGSGTPAYAGDFSVASADKLTVSGAYTVGSAGKFEVSGTAYTNGLKADIAEGSYLKVLGTLNLGGTNDIDIVEVTGTLAVQKSASLESVGVTVMGTLSVAQDAGTVKFNALLVGVTEKEILNSTGASATVSGVITSVEVVLVKPGSVVPESITKLKSTSFLVGDSIYLTGYSDTGMFPIAMIDAHIENARFDGWFNSEGKEATYDDSPVPTTVGAIGETGWDKVTAKVVEDIYKIVLKADSGIADVYIDGNLMSYGMVGTGTAGYYAYTAMVKAGSHTISYTLDNGWSGTATLTVNGQKQSGLTFTTAGTPVGSDKEITYDLQLSGIEKSGYAPDQGKTVDGLTVTEILLIVLVILVVIMAVIVALRLMRS